MKTFLTVPFFYDADSEQGGGGLTDAQLLAGAGAVQSNSVEQAPEDTKQPEAVQQEVETLSEIKGEEKAEVKVEEKPEVIEAPKDWKDAVTDDELIAFTKKKFSKEALLKAAGIDEETIKAIQYKEATGGWNDYLKVKNTDYKNLSAEQLIEMDLKERYADLTKREVEILLKNELRKYNLNREEFEDDSEDAVIGKILLKKDSEAIRTRYIEKQESLKAPEQKPDTTAQEAEQAATRLAETIKNSLPATVFNSSKTLAYGTGEDAFNYKVADPTQIIDAAVKTISNTGQPVSDADFEYTLRTLSFHADQQGFIKAFADYYKKMGERDIAKEQRNIQPGAEVVNSANQPPLTDAQLLAQAGNVKNGY